MNFRNLAAAAAAMTLVAAPVAAQAAPQRAAAPTEQGSELASSWVIAIIAFALIVGAIVIAAKDHNDPVSS